MNGTLYIVGLGPGGLEHLTPAARAAIEAADTVVGYKTYLDFIPTLLAGKQVISSGMMKEVDRCREALDLAGGGRSVALVSSGDAGIYGMAGLVYELIEGMHRSPLDKGGPRGIFDDDTDQIPLNSPLAKGAGKSSVRPDLDIRVIPGISAVQAAAARLGAPLMHDFAVISLSDLLTPWPLIRRRLDAAGRADFVVALYNPRSTGRVRQLDEAREILLRYRLPQTPVGIVRNACRSDETVTVTDLEHLPEHPVDMLSLVLIGNSATYVDRAGRMVTPRGYPVAPPFEKGPGGISSNPETPNPPHSPFSKGEGRQAKALFVGGTGSDVGKSVIAAGLCRILRDRGVSVAPFKAQNMALNSAVTPEGGEIGRAQALQAAACGIPPHTDMNPVLLKPNSDTGSQVIVQGRPVGNMTVREYHRFKSEAWQRVEESYARLAARYEAIVIEGAGSIAEVNLRRHDITNLKAAALAGAPALLVADIDRGGVFAAIVGTLELLEPEERARVAGVVINRFRGDPSLLRSGIELIEDRTGVPVLGVVPWLDLHLPEEDSLALARKKKSLKGRGLRIGVVRLPRLSNYTDFDPLEREPDVDLIYLDDPDQVARLDLLILPGTKSTLLDLEFLRERELVPAIYAYHAAGGRVAGICGGYQMLGRRLSDPLGIESTLGETEGLGLLDVTTELCPAKITRQVTGVALAAAEYVGLTAGSVVRGYEIHQGETLRGPAARPLLRLTHRAGEPVGPEDGAVSADGRVWGTYLHGLFDDAGARRALLAPLRAETGLEPPGEDEGYRLDKELDRLAGHLRTHLNLAPIFALLGLKEEEDS